MSPGIGKNEFRGLALLCFEKSANLKAVSSEQKHSAMYSEAVHTVELDDRKWLICGM